MFKTLQKDKQIKKLRKYFRVLKDWDIQYDPTGDITGYRRQCNLNSDTKRAFIYPWGIGREPDDYIFHELLHICLAEVAQGTYKEKREKEEILVQDVSKLFLKRSKKCYIKELY